MPYGIIMAAIWQEGPWERFPTSSTRSAARVSSGRRPSPSSGKPSARGFPTPRSRPWPRGSPSKARQLAAVLGIPARTLARRKKERRLSAEESDRLLRLGRLAALAEDVLGSRSKASAWLHAGNRALGGAAPLSQLDTDLGAEAVESALLRLAHGVVG